MLALGAAALLVVSAVLLAVFAGASGGESSASSKLARGKASLQALAGNRGEPGGGDADGVENPVAAEEEAYAARAYPADEIPITATQNAIAAWSKLKGKSNKSKNQPGNWTLAGPSSANYPDVLTFSGASYTTSGRVTALAVDPACSQSKCRVWMGAAGGGVWRTDNALSGSGANWTFVSGSFDTNAIGALTYDAASKTLWAGTGESHASGDSAAGRGLWKSTDGGTTCTKVAAVVGPIATSSPGTAGAFPNNGVYTGNAFEGRSISSIAVDPTNPNHLYVGSARGVRGVSSVTGGGTSNPPVPRPPYGLFESTDGGATFSFKWDGSNACPATCNGTSPLASIRGVNRVELDPGYNGTTNTIVYAAAYACGANLACGGVWRSTDGGTNWTQIKSALNPVANTDRAEFAVTKLANGDTRMYVGVGNQQAPAARFYRTDDARAAVPSFADLTTSQNIDYCTGQCWYDNVVYSPPGKPDVVYLGGSYDYGSYGFTNNGRAFIRSSDAGASFTDMPWDATTNPTPAGNCCQPNSIAPNGQHPDSHAIVEIPGTNAAIFGGDGGLMRSSGQYADISSQCTDRGLSGANRALPADAVVCADVPLQHEQVALDAPVQSLSVAADDPKHLQGGTQDNGTFETYGSSVVWPQIIYGDGGQSGFDVGDSTHRFNTFFGQYTDANFQNGDPTKWVIISAPLFAESSLFYKPIIADPAVAGSIFVGETSVWRTQDWGGNQAFLEANCPEFTTPGNQPGCGDFVRIGPAGATNLTASSGDYRGTTRAGGNVAAVERVSSDSGTLWAATTTGRVFISKNADAAAGSVTYARLDNKASATASPGRFVSGIYIDPANPNHAWISYSGYNFNTPAQPGHVFSVTFNGDMGSPDATWTILDGTTFPDFPANDVVADSNGDLYASNDFGVMRLPNGSTDWEVAGTGLPQVESSGLTIVPSARKLYVATHGRSAWALTLP